MFKQRNNKRFSYKPRFNDSSEEKLKDSFEAKWNEARGKTKLRGSFLTSLPALILMLVAIVILMYILDGYMK